jgi:DNA (cytosine-5)-methyltransferase 1
MGLHRAFPAAEIVGVDIAPQENYPFAFVCADAMTYPLDGYDFIWASPPCQRYTALANLHKDRSYPDLLAPTRDRLLGWGGPWIIENVVGAPLLWSAQLCGAMFGLRTYRHRRFEAPFLMLAPPHLPHFVRTNATGRQRKARWLNGEFASVTGNIGSYCGPEAMGISWMTGDELSQAVPPAYSEYLARFIPLAGAR